MNRPNRYPQELEDFAREHVDGMSTEDLARLVSERFGIDMTTGKMRAYKKNHGLRSGLRGPGKGRYRTFPAEIREYIESNISGTPVEALKDMVNDRFGTSYTYNQIRAHAHNNGLTNGVVTRFELGRTPQNKGVKGVCSPGCEKGWFKAGHTPANKTPIGTVLVKSDGYLWQKIGEGCRDWRQKHILVWEEHHGPVPDGCVITFLDGDRTNVSIDNLACITRAEHSAMTRWNLRSEIPEITEAGIALCKVKKAVIKAKKAGKNNDRKL